MSSFGQPACDDSWRDSRLQDLPFQLRRSRKLNIDTFVSQRQQEVGIVEAEPIRLDNITSSSVSFEASANEERAGETLSEAVT